MNYKLRCEKIDKILNFYIDYEGPIDENFIKAINAALEVQTNSITENMKNIDKTTEIVKNMYNEWKKLK
jgi:hypothetical protein